jgi:hypothetical protein
MSLPLRRALLLLTVPAAACLPGAITHYQAELVPVATCAIVSGRQQCDDPGDAGTREFTSLSVDERGEDSRVFLRQEAYPAVLEGGRLTSDDVRETVSRTSSCRTRASFRLDALQDDPGFGTRGQLTGVLEETNTTEGDPQQCGRNVPYGEIRRYRLTAVEVTQP